MTVLAIDPGSEQSAWVLWDGQQVRAHGKWMNGDLEEALADSLEFDVAVFEQIASYGMAVGAEVFETCVWTGRFIGAVKAALAGEWDRLPRRDVKLHLCGQARAKDANIRQALIDRFGGKEKAIGRKASPGPLFGIKADEWAALALAITWFDQQIDKAKTA